MKNKTFTLSAAAFLVLVLAGIYLYITTAAVVGWSRITHDQVKLRNRIMRIYDPTENRDLGLQQMIQSKIRFEILKNQGIAIRDGDLKAEAKRIELQTLSPDRIENIKKVFGSDLDSYYQVFILPILVDQKIYSVVTYGNRELHHDSYAQAKAFIASISNQSSEQEFYKSVVANGGQSRKLLFNNKKGLLWAEPGIRTRNFQVRIPQDLRQGLSWEKDYFQNMKEKEVLTEPLDNKDVWLVTQLEKKEIKNSETLYTFNVGVFLKLDPSTWLQKKSKRIRVLKF